MALNTSLYGCRSGYPMAGTNKTQMLAGRESFDPLPEDCLGGYRASEWKLHRDFFHPLLFGYDGSSVPPTNPKVYRLFRDVTAAEASAGVTLYRGFFISVDTGTQVYLNPSTSAAALSCWFDTINTDTVTGNYYVQRIANETTAPSGASWTSAPSKLT